VRVRLAVVLVAALASGCGDDDAERDQARADYRAYRVAEDARTDAEHDLRRAVSAIGAAASERDREGVIAAATRGQAAADEIHRLLERELEAAAGLASFEPISGAGRRLAAGLHTTRRGLEAVESELAIAHKDPFLDDEQNVAEIRRLARQVVILSRDGELAIRRGDRAIAIELGLDPRPDSMLEEGDG
jgi:hypothetical protein